MNARCGVVACALALLAGGALARDTGHLLRIADAADVEAVPLDPAQRDRYREYRALRSPKAFAIDEHGNGRHVEHARDAMARVLERCAQEHVRCWLYAVDDRVVWSADVDKRIGLASQLEDDRLLRPTLTPPPSKPRPRS